MSDPRTRGRNERDRSARDPREAIGSDFQSADQQNHQRAGDQVQDQENRGERDNDVRRQPGRAYSYESPIREVLEAPTLDKSIMQAPRQKIRQSPCPYEREGICLLFHFPGRAVPNA